MEAAFISLSIIETVEEKGHICFNIYLFYFILLLRIYLFLQLVCCFQGGIGLYYSFLCSLFLLSDNLVFMYVLKYLCFSMFLLHNTQLICMRDSRFFCVPWCVSVEALSFMSIVCMASRNRHLPVCCQVQFY